MLKSKAFWITVGVLIWGGAMVAAANSPEPTQASVEAPSAQVIPTSPESTKEISPPVETPHVEAQSLSNDNTYTNVDGNTIHSPAYAPSGCEAAGASAQCRDGTCSFSQHRNGTCSHHGGVSLWL